MAKKTTTAKKPTVAKKSFSGNPIHEYRYMEVTLGPAEIYGRHFVLPESVDNPNVEDSIYDVTDFRVPDTGDLFISLCGKVSHFEKYDLDEWEQPRLIVKRTRGREFTIKEIIGDQSLESDTTFIFDGEEISVSITQVKD